jgi:hypothetical protein
VDVSWTGMGEESFWSWESFVFGLELPSSTSDNFPKLKKMDCDLEEKLIQ